MAPLLSLSRIELSGLGPFDGATLELPDPAGLDEGGEGGLVLLEGPNGSGKTTALEALAVLLGCSKRFAVNLREWDWARNQGAAEYIRLMSGYVAAERWQSNAPPTLPPYVRLWDRFRDPSGYARATLAQGESRLSIEVDRVHGWRSSTDTGPIYALLDDFVQRAAEAPLEAPPLAWAAFAFRGYQTNPVLKAESPGEIARPPLRGAMSFGEFGAGSLDLGKLLLNLDYYRARDGMKASHAVTAEERQRYETLAASRTEAIRRFETTLTALLDADVKIEFPEQAIDPRILFDGEPIPVHLLGEGLRQTLAWVTDLLVRLERVRWVASDQPPTHQPFWLLLDEIDQGLHPKLQARILPALRALFPNATIIATTHSPFMVASVGEGHVFSLRADARHRVAGTIAPQKLEHGQSLEWVIEEVFGTGSLFVDPVTVERLKQHQVVVDALRRNQPVEDWDAFRATREWLMSISEEVRAVVAMREAPIRPVIEDRLAEATR